MCVHSLVHFFFWLPPRHALTTFFRSFFLHVFLSLSAVQFFGDGVGAVPLLLLFSGADSIFRMSTIGVVDGATAPTHSKAQNAASHLIRRGRTTCGADHTAVRGTERMKAPGKTLGWDTRLR